MFKFIVLVAICGLAAAASLDSDTKADFQIIENSIASNGFFRYAFQTSNGILASEVGDENLVSGAYKYVSPEGKNVEIKYTAGADGYKPTGDLLPTPPPVPEAILRSIEWNLAHPVKEDVLLSLARKS